MSRAMFFYHPCPACGRLLEIHIRHLGREFECIHCGYNLIATDTDGPPTTMVSSRTCPRDDMLDTATESHDDDLPPR